MKNILNSFWHDTRAEISATGMILLVVLVCIGSIVGLTTVRDYVVQEFGDMAVGLENLDQSYSYMIEIDTNNDMTPDITIMCSFVDPATTLMDEDGEAPACITFTAPTAEGT